MEGWLFGLIFIGSIGLISILIFYKCHQGFAIAFFFHGAILMAVSIWEAPIWNPGDAFYCTGSWDWHWGFWGLTQMFLIPGLILAMFIYAQSREEHYQKFGKQYVKETVTFLGFVIGNYLVFGPLEDFGCYVIWGLDKFYAYAPLFHGANFFLGIPTLYFLIIPGVILQTITLLYSRKFRKVKTSAE